MDQAKTYLSFWHIELSNIPVETIFRRRVLSTAEARKMVSAGRQSGTLLCVAADDIGAPFGRRELERYEELCAALRDHTDINIHVNDFFGDHCANPLCIAEIGDQRRLLVVECHYAFVNRPGADHIATEGLDPKHRSRDALKMRIDPYSIRFCVFEQIGPRAPSAVS